MLPPSYRAVLAHRHLRPLLGGFAASALGDGMSFVAVAWLAVEMSPEGEAGPLVAAAVAAYAIPGILGAALLGRWLRDRPAKTLLTADSTLRAAALGAIPIAAALGLLHPVLYVVLLGVSSLLHAWGSGGKYTLVAETLPHEARLAGNALVSTINSVSVVAGPALAGVATGWIGPAWVIGLDALSFAVLAVQSARFRPERPAPPEQPDGPSATATSAPPKAADGARMLLRDPRLLGLFALTWFFYLVYGPFEVALPLYVADHLDSPASVLGWYWASYGVGAALGALAGGAVRRVRLWPLLITVVAGWGAVLLPFGPSGTPLWVTMACMFVGGVLYGPFAAVSMTLVQEAAPPGRMASVLAARSAFVLSSAPVGTALGGPLVVLVEPRLVIVGSGAATLLIAAVAAAAAGGAWWRTRGHAAHAARHTAEGDP